MIEKNVGGLDRGLRAVAGVGLAGAGLAAGTGFLPGLGPTPIAGAVLLSASAGVAFTAVTQRCPGNRLLGIDTCPGEE